jgi:ketol-acid reductoisomerase
MATLHWADDTNAEALAGKEVAVLGYGSQGRAQALNLRDSGCNVVVGVREGGNGLTGPRYEGFAPVPCAAATAAADVVAVLLPDMAQPAVFRSEIAPHLRPGAALLFAHGFNVHYGRIEPGDDVDVVLIAPKAPGNLLRRHFERGSGVPCLLAVHRDATGAAFDRALAYADALGCTRAGVIETTFAEETETDLFGEQAVLCGGVTELVVAGWETLVDAGYQPEVAYFECLNELKLIVDLLYEGGFAAMHAAVSETAKYGDLSRGGRIVDEHVRASMREILAEVRSGAFAREWIDEDEAGRPRYERLLAADLDHPIEHVGRRLRAGRAGRPGRAGTVAGGGAP